MVQKRGMPQQGELVICKIAHLNPHSASAVLEEYQFEEKPLEGMIHISEISSGWVRDIRNHIKIGQKAIAKVLWIDEQSKQISISLKRVDRKQEKEKMKEFNLEQKAERMLEIAAKKLNKTLPDAYEQAGFAMQENFGSLYEGFRKTLTSPHALVEKGIPEFWVAPLKEIAEKTIEQKEFEFRATLTLRTQKPGGIDLIKSVLLEAEKLGLDVRYIAAPEYLVKYRTKNAKRGEKEFAEMMEKLAGSKNVEAHVAIAK